MTGPALEQAFAGTWRLVSYEFRRADGKLTFPLGEDPSGMLIYDAEGNMAAQALQRNRSRFRADSVSGGSAEEIREAFEGYIAYFGTWEVDEQAGAVIHHVIGSWYPNFIGSDQVRYYEFQGNRLLLRTPPRESGKEKRTGLLVWERAAAPQE
jgi:hypothetical protein